MMNRFQITVLFLCLSGCYSPTDYSGDGTLIDRGWLEPSTRYVVDLGTVDLGTSHSEEYMLSGLPRVKFTIGFLADSLTVRSAASAVVQIVLEDQSGELLLHDRRRLSDWVHGESSLPGVFLYLSDRKAVSTLVATASQYRLRVSVESSVDDMRSLFASLLLIGGGWQ